MFLSLPHIAVQCRKTLSLKRRELQFFVAYAIIYLFTITISIRKEEKNMEMTSVDWIMVFSSFVYNLTSRLAVKKFRSRKGKYLRSMKWSVSSFPFKSIVPPTPWKPLATVFSRNDTHFNRLWMVRSCSRVSRLQCFCYLTLRSFKWKICANCNSTQCATFHPK